MLADVTNFNVKSHSKINGFISCELETGEILIDSRLPITLYAWTHGTGKDAYSIFTTTDTPTTENKAIAGLTSGDIEAITKVEADGITADSTKFTRDKDHDIIFK